MINPKTFKHSLWADAIRRLSRDKVAMISFFIILTYMAIAVLTKLGLLYPNISLGNNANNYAPPSLDH
jgi:hypothetical protein